MSSARLVLGCLFALWSAALAGGLAVAPRSPVNLHRRLPAALVLLGSAMELLAPLFIPLSAHPLYGFPWVLAGACAAAWGAFSGGRHRPGALACGPLFDRSQQLAVQCGLGLRTPVYVSSVSPVNADEVALRTEEVRALSAREIDALLVRQFCRHAMDWNYEAQLLAVSVAATACALAAFHHMPAAGHLLLLGFFPAVAAFVAVVCAPQAPARRAARLLGDPQAMLTALHAQAALNGHPQSPAEFAALAQSLDVPTAALPALAALPLPRPSGERYPWSSAA